MKKIYKRLGVLLLSICLVLGLAACGGREDGEDSDTQLSGTVYVPRFIDLNLDGECYFRQGCADGTNVYMLLNYYPEEGDSYYEICRAPLEGGAPEKLENFQPPEAPEGFDYAYSYANSLCAGAEGTLWLGVTVGGRKFDLPESFDPEKDEMWEYPVLEELHEQYQIQLDSTGNIISRVDVTGLEEKAELDYIDSEGMIFDRDGDLFLCSQGKIVVLDPSMNVRFTLEDDSLWGNAIVLLSDGSVGARLTIRDLANDTYSRQLRVIDKSAKNWGTGYTLPDDAYQLYAGGGDYLFYYEDGQDICGMRADTEEGEKLVNWMDSDINSDEVEFFTFLPDGRMVVMIESWTIRGSNRTQLAVLTATDRSQLPEKTILTYATLGLGQAERARILDFNKSSQTYRIEVRDYSEYNTDGNYDAGIQKLNTEIIAGTVPDIINTNNLPLRQYGAKGYLEDLWPYIDSDPDLGRDKLMERVFNAAEQDGKLYQIFDSFSISTAVGARSVVGDRMSWTLADLQEALSTMPEGCAIFSAWNTKTDMLNYVVMMNLDSFLDWDNGKCNFDSPEFKAMLEFCNSFPAEYESNGDYDEESDRLAEGRQMLRMDTLYEFEEIQVQKAMLGGEISFVGFPMEDGSVGSCFTIYSGLAMSTTCKDKEGAWSFLREVLLPQYAGSDGDSLWWGRGGFPTNKADFEWMAKEAMTPAGYETDEDGNQVLDENGDPIEVSNYTIGWGNGMSISVYATSQEEYDQIMALYNAVDRMSGQDREVMEIVSTVAGSYFAGDRSLDDAAALMQNRANNYINEQR